MAKITPVILCGGSGSRLWPLSRENHPKQFVDLGGGRTLFGDTLKRLAYLENCAPPVCVCNEKYRFYAAPAIEALEGAVILEPCPRSTAPAIALAALGACDRLLLVLPADHYFGDPRAFAAVAANAASVAESGKIVAFGIEPAAPATGFGYIRAGAKISPGCFKVEEFIEKPSLNIAEAMLAEGGYYWNAGIFLLRPDVYLQELGKFAPEILERCETAFANRATRGALIRPERSAFESCPADSIDYAIMEHTDLAAVAPLVSAWNDLGSWDAFYEKSAKDEAGNASEGRVLLHDVGSSYIHSSGRLVAAIGVSDLAIVETADAILVANRNRVQDVRTVVDRLKQSGANEYRQHRKVERPWGSYEILSEGERFQVKRIIVRPGEALSLQMHHHRAEHWIVVSGTAEITTASQTGIFTENQSTYIPVGVPHKLANPGLIPLTIIEIQSGAYLGEDDIVRLADPYAREKNE